MNLYLKIGEKRVSLLRILAAGEYLRKRMNLMKVVKIEIAVVLAALLICPCPAQEGKTDPSKTGPKPMLVGLKGIVQKPGEKPVAMETGWAMFVKSGDLVHLSVAPDEDTPQENPVTDPKGPEQKKVFLFKQGHTLRWETTGGTVEKYSSTNISYKLPPSPGTYKVSAMLMDESVFSLIEPEQAILEDRNIIGSFVFHFLVMYPFDREGAGVIESYPIGLYPNEEAEDVREPVASHKAAYRPPKFFIKVTAENALVPISRHFNLGDFSPEGEKGKEHFIALDYSIVERLEQILTALREKGIKVNRLKILRGYLSPNEVERMRRKKINIAAFSRSLYGDSATFIIDEDNDGIMDDLTGDGKLDASDLTLVSDVVKAIESQTRLYGGTGVYYHFQDLYHKDTPCIQVDTRGWHTSWGDTPDEKSPE